MIEGETIDRVEGPGGSAWMLNHLPRILWQRRVHVVRAFLLVLVAGIVAAYSLPTLYRSTATLLVQSQELPSEIVEAPGAGQIEERIAKIRERVLSRGDLISLIEQNDLYHDERRSNPMSYVVDKMRRATTIGSLAGDIGQTGSSKNDVIAVTMSFDYPEPEKAQAVLQSYVTSFLKLDSNNAEDQANLTLSFLQDQAGKLQAQIDSVERQMTDLKARNGAALANVGVPSLMDTGSYTAQITNLENQNRQLLAASRSPQADTQLAQAEAALAAAQATYSDSHPDVVQARARVEALKRMGANSGTDPNASIQEQIKGNNAAIASLTAARQSLVSRTNAAMAGQARAPAILEQAMQLENRASALRDQYKTVSTDLLKAQNSSRMTNEQRAERLSLVEPPNLPDTPHWPNRPLMIGGAAVAGLALGLLLALALELLLRPLRSTDQVEALGYPLLGAVPLLHSDRPKKRFGIFRRRETGFA
jgi:succinoglycan biosynthesis transport protein ExoP